MSIIIMKKTTAMLFMLLFTASLTGCGKSAGEGGFQNLEGSLSEILNTVYENAEFDQEFRDSMADFDTNEIPAESAEYIIGTTDVEYTESIYSIPMINVVPYQCILLRLPEGADVEAAKQTLLDHADPRKWICVEAESVVVENVGDVVLFIMADADKAEAVRSSFLALAK